MILIALLACVYLELLIWFHRREARVMLERERFLAHELICASDPRYAEQLQREIRNAAYARNVSEQALTRMGVLL